MLCLCAEQLQIPSSTQPIDENKLVFEYDTVLFFGTTELNITRPIILESIRETIALEASVSVDRVINISLSRSTRRRRLHSARNLNDDDLVSYDLQFVIVFSDYASSEASSISLSESFESDPTSNEKSDFADLFFSTYVHSLSLFV